MDPQRLPPRLLLTSFVWVVGVYLAVILAQLAATIGLGWIFFPQTFARWLEKPLTPEAYAAQLDLMMPSSLFWSASGLTAIACVALGFGLSRRAAFAPRAHALFAALLIAMTQLQSAVGNPAPMRWMSLVGMALFPLGIVLGSTWASRTQKSEVPDSDESSH